MYVRIFVCKHIGMYACMHVSTNMYDVCMQILIYVLCMHSYTVYVCVYECLHFIGMSICKSVWMLNKQKMNKE